MVVKESGVENGTNKSKRPTKIFRLTMARVVDRAKIGLDLGVGNVNFQKGQAMSGNTCETVEAD